MSIGSSHCTVRHLAAAAGQASMGAGSLSGCEGADRAGIPQASSIVGSREYSGTHKFARHHTPPKTESQPWLSELLSLGSPNGRSSSFLLFACNMVSKGHVSALFVLQILWVLSSYPVPRKNNVCRQVEGGQDEEERY